MTKLEKVRNGLWMCEGGPENCGLKNCPYFDKREFCENEMHRDALALLKEQPEIVRCNECKYALHDDLSGGVFCTKLTEKYTTQDDKAVSENWFCADGKRRCDDA